MASVATCLVGRWSLTTVGWEDGQAGRVDDDWGAKDTKEGLGNLFRAAREDGSEEGGKKRERDTVTAVDPPKGWLLALSGPDGRTRRVVDGGIMAFTPGQVSFLGEGKDDDQRRRLVEE